MLAAAACGGGDGGGDSNGAPQAAQGWDAILKAANEEGEVVVMDNGQEVAEAVAAEFMKKYPEIKVTVVPGNADSPAKILAEKDAGIVSVDYYASGTEPFHADANVMVKLTPENLPVLKELEWPEGSVGDAGTWVATRRQFSLFGWNTKLFPQGADFTKWSEVLDPRLKGHIALSDIRVGDTQFVWVTAVDKVYGDEFLTKLADMDLRITEGQGTSAAGQDIGSGAAWVAFPITGTTCATVLESGAPIGCKVLEDPAVAVAGFGSVLKDAPHPNAALVWANYRHGVEGMTVACDVLGRPGENGVMPGFTPVTPIPECQTPPQEEVQDYPRYPEGDPERNRMTKLLGLDPTLS